MASLNARTWRCLGRVVGRLLSGHPIDSSILLEVNWTQIIRETDIGQRVAKYHCSLTETAVRDMEVRCVQELGAAIIPPKPHVIEFFMEITDLGFPVGASLGQLTNFIYVEYHQAGTVHGRPIITWNELRRKF